MLMKEAVIIKGVFRECTVGASTYRIYYELHLLSCTNVPVSYRYHEEAKFICKLRWYHG